MTDRVLAAATRLRPGCPRGRSGGSSKLRFTAGGGDRTGSATTSVSRVDGRPGPGPLPDAAAGPHRPSHRAAGPQAQAGALRSRRAGRPGARRHQEARPDPRRRRLAGLRARLRQAPASRRGTRPSGHARRAGSRGYVYLHHAVDDHSRLAYSEILADERKETAAALLGPARTRSSPSSASPSRAVMTDNGSCYRSHDFAERARRDGQAPPHPALPTRRPTGKSSDSTAPSPPNGPTPRSTSPTKPAPRPTPTGSTHYNHHRPHTGIGGPSPSTAFTTSRGTTSSPGGRGSSRRGRRGRAGAAEQQGVEQLGADCEHAGVAVGEHEPTREPKTARHR